MPRSVTVMHHNSHALLVNSAECEHCLRKVSYNERVDLSEQLDDLQQAKNIGDLIKELLTVEEFEDIWKACHGGSDPPMNLLFHLSGKNCTLETFRSYAEQDKKGRFQDLIKLIDGHKDSFGKRLNALDFKLLIAITKLIGAKPHPTSEQAKPQWKRLASTAHLSDADIATLNAPASRVTEGLTMAFFQQINSRYPDERVAWLANGIKNIGRGDLLQCEDFEIFDACKTEGCIVITERNA